MHKMIEAARERLKYITPSDDELIPIKEAVYLPVLGGVMRRSGQHTASKSFTRASLDGAIKKGELQAVWKGGKLFVTYGGVKAWAADPGKGRKDTVPVSPVSAYVPPDERTAIDKRQASVAQAMATSTLDSIDEMLGKNKKKKGR
jgi:hypothetical protein